MFTQLAHESSISEALQNATGHHAYRLIQSGVVIPKHYAVTGNRGKVVAGYNDVNLMVWAEDMNGRKLRQITFALSDEDLIDKYFEDCIAEGFNVVE